MRPTIQEVAATIDRMDSNLTVIIGQAARVGGISGIDGDTLERICENLRTIHLNAKDLACELAEIAGNEDLVDW